MLEFSINFGTETTNDTKLDALKEFVGEGVAIITSEYVVNGALAEIGSDPEPFVKIRYAVKDEDLGITSIIVRQILLAHVVGFSVL